MRRPIIAGNWKMFKTRLGDARIFRPLIPAILGMSNIATSSLRRHSRRLPRRSKKRMAPGRHLRSGCTGDRGRVHRRSLGADAAWMRLHATRSSATLNAASFSAKPTKPLKRRHVRPLPAGFKRLSVLVKH